jgi:hypothetical protein
MAGDDIPSRRLSSNSAGELLEFRYRNSFAIARLSRGESGALFPVAQYAGFQFSFAQVHLTAKKSRPNFTGFSPRRLVLDCACVLARRA